MRDTDDKPTLAKRPVPTRAKRPVWWKQKSVRIALIVVLAVGVLAVGSVAFIALVVALPSQPGVMKPNPYPREELETMLMGKTEAEVLKLIGKPEKTIKDSAFTLWLYPDISVDKITGKTDSRMHLTIKHGVVTDVGF